ncbi:MAG: SigE family RNA polymerase sigma factor [Pseudonocardiales bacterium]|nr:MAG: SigE family RNA polymerase sigma factor [Pseudonocardiales bacterium]
MDTFDVDQAVTDLMSHASDGAVRLGFQLTHNWATAEDLVQEALLRIYRVWTRRPPEQLVSPDAYLRKTVVNLFLEIRRTSASTEVVTHLPGAGGGAVPDFSQQLVDRDVLWEALASLPQRQRAALVLRHFESLSHSEIGEILRCRESTARSLTTRGLATLRKTVAMTAAMTTDTTTRTENR